MGEAEVMGWGWCWWDRPMLPLSGSAVAGTKLSGRRWGRGYGSRLLGMCRPSWKWNRMEKVVLSRNAFQEGAGGGS